jgi:hypothetical protein
MTTQQTAAIANSVISDLSIRCDHRRAPLGKLEQMKMSEWQVDWDVHFYRGNDYLFSIEYHQGIGHLMGFKHGDNSAAMHNAVKVALSNGHSIRGHAGLSVSVVQPTIDDVMYCLIMDLYGDGLGSFEEFCSELGYNVDSRKDYATWEAVRKQNETFRKHFTGQEIESLQEAFQDY